MDQGAFVGQGTFAACEQGFAAGSRQEGESVAVLFPCYTAVM